MKKEFKTFGKWLAMILLTFTMFATSGCSTDASVASRNLAQAADNFELERRIVFLNGITDKYILSIEGRCSIEDRNKQLEVTCKTGPSSFKKHHLGLSDNVTYFSEQLESKTVSVYHYKVIFKPQVILPDIDFKGSTTAIQNAL